MVQNEKAWKAAIRKREAVRDGVLADAKEAVGSDPVALDQLQQIRSDMTNQSLPNQEAAKAMIEKHISRMAHHHQQQDAESLGTLARLDEHVPSITN